MVGRKSWSPAAVGEKLRPRTELAILWSSYCVLSCDSGVSALISRILNKWQLLHPPILHVPMAGCQQSYIYPSSRTHPRSRTSKVYTGTRTHRCSGISCNSLLSHSLMHAHKPVRTLIQGNKKNKKRQHNVRLKATCTVRMMRSWFAHKNQTRGQNFKNKNATHLKCTCGRERLKDGDITCVCGLCLKGLLPWVTS